MNLGRLFPVRFSLRNAMNCRDNESAEIWREELPGFSSCVPFAAQRRAICGAWRSRRFNGAHIIFLVAGVAKSKRKAGARNKASFRRDYSKSGAVDSSEAES